MKQLTHFVRISSLDICFRPFPKRIKTVTGIIRAHKDTIKNVFSQSVLFIILSLRCSYPDPYENISGQDSELSSGIEMIPNFLHLKETEECPLSVILLNDDGTRQILNPEMIEFKSNECVKVNRSGIAKGIAEGEGIITATYNGLSTETHATVIPLPDYNSLLITEVMYDPDGEDTGKEYIEIHNHGDRPCDLSGVSLIDSNLSSKAFSFGDYTIPSGGYCIVGQSHDNFVSAYLIEPDLYPFSYSLANPGDSVFLKTPDGRIIDAVYIKNGGETSPPTEWGPQIYSHDKKSLARINHSSDTNRSSDFMEQDPSPGR
jgi:hypothetical protein